MNTINRINLKLGQDKREVGVTANEITVLLGQTTGKNIHASLVHAERLLHEENTGNVLYINTVQTTWKIAESIRRAFGIDQGTTYENFYLEPIGPKHGLKNLHILNSELGQLIGDKEKILRQCRELDIRTIVINCWECAASDSRTRDKLLYLLRSLNRGKYEWDQESIESDQSGRTWKHYDYHPTTVLIYAEDQPGAEAGKIHRRGFGKLMIMADSVIRIEEELPVAQTGKADSQSIQEVSELTAAEMEVVMAPVFMPPANMGRKKSGVPRAPIHLNNYAADKKPASRQKNTGSSAKNTGSKTPDVHSDVIEK